MAKIKKKIALIFGITGQDGSYLAEFLLKKSYVIHGFRHAFRDRLRAVECSSDIIDQLGGWSLRSIGEGYGRGYDLDVLYKWFSKI